MLKYTNFQVCFQEVPDEITLAINISGCPCHCMGCHSPYLAEDIGTELTFIELRKLIKINKGITCVSFMGGDSDHRRINSLALFIRTDFPELKVAWYSGRERLSKEIGIENFDIIKLGGYSEEYGPLNVPTTNQKFYRVIGNTLFDYTYLFWKDSDTEVWRDIEGANGYQVSNLGNVRSLNYNGTKLIKTLQPCKSGRNRSYLSISMQIGTKVIRRNIHRLVAKAFIPNPNNLPEINHIDECGTNNRVNNLEWCDRKYNLSYGTRVARFINSKSVPILQYDLEGNLVKEWKSQTDICKELGLDIGSLSHCLHGYRIKRGKRFVVHSYAGYKWKYKDD